MNRKIARLISQLGVGLTLLLVAIYFLDSRYRVLPTKVHNYLPSHHPGLVLTDITITTCSSLGLLGGCNLDTRWTRIEKDLLLDKGWFSHAYLQVLRTREEDLRDTDQVILDVRIGRLDPSTSEKNQGHQKWESRPGGLWILRSAKRHASDSQHAVTAADVLFGADAVDPRVGWEIKDQAFMISGFDEAREPRLSIHRGTSKMPPKPIPRISKDGKFKIVQVSDLHLSTGTGVCRDAVPPSPGHCEADPRTLEFVGRILDSEKPDLVVLSGDQINGETSPDAQTAVLKFAELFIKRSIPYALIFGNHDDEGSLSRSALMSMMDTLPFSLSEAGPATVDGVGNYIVEVLARGTSHHSALTLYLLDTHAYSPDESRFHGYDWLKRSQIEWFRERAHTLRSSSAHKDYAHIRLNMAFVHIPLPEYRDTALLAGDTGTWREPPTAPAFNAGFKDVLVENGVFAVSCGHDHANDYCSLAPHSQPGADALAELSVEAVKNSRNLLWMCYAGGSGYGGYGGYGGYQRRVRVWDFDMNDARVETWKRVDGVEGREDVKIVVESGKVVA